MRRSGRESIQQRSRAGLVRTFQTPKVFEQMTVLENVMVGCCKLTRTTMLQDLLRTPRARGEMREIRERAEAACERFQLGALRDLPRGQPAGRTATHPRDRPRRGRQSRTCCCSTSPRPA